MLICLLIVLLGLGVVAFLLLQPRVQTWAAKQAATYFSKELHTTVQIDSLGIADFKTLYIAGLLIKDLNNDTMLYAGNLRSSLGLLAIDNQQLTLQNAQLQNAVVRLTRHKNTGNFNYDFLVNYFAPPTPDTDTTRTEPWLIQLKNIGIKNTRFAYHDNRYTPTTTPTIDYNHLVINNLNLIAQNLHIGYNYQADIKHISLTEQKGFEIDSLESELAITNQFISLQKLNLKTPNTYINGDFMLKYNNFNELVDDFVYKAKFDANIKKSLVAPSDIAYFAPEINIITQPIALSGKVNGSIDQLSGNNIILKTKDNNANFEGDFAFDGLMQDNFDNAHLKLTARNANFSKTSIENTIRNLRLPTQLAALGSVNFKGAFDGFLKNFNAKGNFITQVGNLNTQIQLKLQGKKTQYNAYILADNLDVGKIIQDPTIGKISIDGTIKGTGNTLQNAAANIQGKVIAANIKGYNYQNILLDGNVSNSLFQGKFNSSDPSLALNFDGKIDFKNQQNPTLDFESNIKKIDLYQLKISDKPATLSGDMVLKFTGSTLDDFNGTANLKNIIYAETGKTLKSQYLDLQSFNSDTGKVITLKSDIADVNISGKFKFDAIADALKIYLKNYLPSYDFGTTAAATPQAFVLDANIKNGNIITDFLYPNTYKFAPITAQGSFDNTQNKLTLTAKTDFFETQGYRATNIEFRAQPKEDKLFFRANFDNLTQKDSVLLGSFVSENTLSNDSVQFSIKALGEKSANQARLKGTVNLLGKTREISFEKGRLALSGQNWKINPDSRILLDSLGGVQFKKFIIAYDNDSINQYIQVGGRLSDSPNDVLRLLVNGFNLSLLNPFLTTDLQIGGIAKIDAKVAGISTTPNIFVDADVADFTFNNELLGDIRLFSDWNEPSQRVDVTGLIIKTRSIDTLALLAGNIKLNKQNTPYFDFDLSLNQSTITPIQALLAPYLTDITGLATGGLRLYGTPNQPLLTGFARISKGTIRVDYLNTLYNLNTQINFNQKSIDFVNSDINDGKSGICTVSGSILHNYFNDIAFNLLINAQNLLVLNTTETPQSYFYGKAKGTGYVTIKGGLDDMHFDVGLTTEKGTDISLPISSGGYSRETNFIHFINPKDTTTANKPNENLANLSGIDFNFNFRVTPDATLKIIFDKIAGDKITAKGKGDIRLFVNKQTDITMNGNLAIESGDYLFTYSDIFNKNFKIQQGSLLSWSGDPLDANININAAYSVNATVPSEIQASMGSTVANIVPVNCILKMKGSMLTPDVNFEIAQNNSGTSISSPLQAYISRINSNEQELNEQMLSLMLASKFSNLNNILSDVSTTAIEAGVGTVSELLSNQFNSILDNYTKRLNIGVNYRATPFATIDQQSIGSLQVAVSSTFFNDRLEVGGNFGSIYDQLGGDANISYKLTTDGRWLLRGFNRIDDRFTTDLAYRQGVGASYNREFDSYKELFKNKKL